MKEIRYVLLNPTGNLTCLVLDPVSAAERKGITAALMDRCEQVGYLIPPENARAAARLQMMGGEFCGNASMATAVFLAARNGSAPDGEVLLEVSGAEGLVPCRAERTEAGWAGTVEMPLPRSVQSCEIAGEKLAAVRFPGMVHLIRTGPEMRRDGAEALLRKAEALFAEPAAGLLQWREETGSMIPLVRVRESGTQVWETACGSGAAAIAAWKTVEAGAPVKLRIRQPGGVLAVETRWSRGAVTGIRLSGHVGIGAGIRVLEWNGSA